MLFSQWVVCLWIFLLLASVFGHTTPPPRSNLLHDIGFDILKLRNEGFALLNNFLCDLISIFNSTILRSTTLAWHFNVLPVVLHPVNSCLLLGKLNLVQFLSLSFLFLDVIMQPRPEVGMALGSLRYAVEGFPI